MRQSLRYFPVRLKMTFPRPGHARVERRCVGALSRPARFRAARKGLALMRRGAAPDLGMLGLIGMAHLEIAAVTQHRPSNAGQFVGERDGKFIGVQPSGCRLDPGF